MDSETPHRASPFLSTLGNGLRAIEVLADGRLSLRDLSARLELPRQTAYRIVHTLISAGWAERHESDDTYGLTPRLWGVGVRSHVATDLRGEWASTVTRLAADTGETVHLAVYDQGWSVYIGKEDGWQPIRSYTQLGGRSPAHCVATGKVLLAAQNSDETERVLTEQLKRFTPNTITHADRMREELTAIREQGWATNNGEYHLEVGGIAVPIRSPLGDVVASLGFSGPAHRIRSRSTELLSALASATAPQSEGPTSLRGRASRV